MYTLGIDIGSTTSKCVVLEDGRRIAGSALVTGGIGTQGPEGAWVQALRVCGLDGRGLPVPQRQAMAGADGKGRSSRSAS